MPIKDAARKSMRKDVKRGLRNLSTISALRTAAKKAISKIESKEKEAASELVRLYCKKLDMAATKKIIHKNNASGKKSSIMKRFNKAFTA